MSSGIWAKTPNSEDLPEGAFKNPDHYRQILTRMAKEIAWSYQLPVLDKEGENHRSLETAIEEVQTLTRQEVIKARIEGAEMCQNELFGQAKSVNGTITLDTGETAIRFNNLLKELRNE